MEQILLAYGLPKVIVTAIMMVYKITKVKFHSPDGDTNFFDVVVGVLQGDSPTSLHNLPRVRTLNINRSNERKWLNTKNGKKQMIPHTNYYGDRLYR